MAGNKIGGRKAAATNIARHGKDFYKRLGHLGGSVVTDKPKGFAADHERARLAGMAGGRKSKKTEPMPRDAEGYALRKDGRRWGSDRASDGAAR